MIHQANNLFFGATFGGDVRILKLNTFPDEWPKMGYIFPENTILDVTIPKSQWDCIIACVGKDEDLFSTIDFFKGLL